MKFKFPSMNVLIAKRNSGKSHFLAWLLYLSRNVFDYGYVFNKTYFNGFWKQFVPESWIYPTYTEEMIRKVMKRQQDIIEKVGKENAPQIFLIFDDEVADMNAHHSKLFDDLSMNGRHYNITCYVTCQYANKISPTMRTQTDYCFLFTPSSHNVLDILYRNYSKSMNKKDFGEFLLLNTENYGVVIYDNLTKSNNLNDVYTVTRAPAELPKFKFVEK